MENISKNEIGNLAEEWIRLQVLTDNNTYAEIFSDIGIIDYFILEFLQEKLGFGYDKTYLKEISEKISKPINHVSSLVQHLQDQGLVEWKHDENGTFIKLSKVGSVRLEKQKAKINGYFEKVISAYGVDKFKQLVALRKEFNAMLAGTHES